MSLAAPFKVSRMTLGVRAALINAYLRANNPRMFQFIFGLTKFPPDKPDYNKLGK